MKLTVLSVARVVFNDAGGTVARKDVGQLYRTDEESPVAFLGS